RPLAKMGRALQKVAQGRVAAFPMKHQHWTINEAIRRIGMIHEFIRDYHERANARNRFTTKPHLDDEVVGVFEGQQRISLMYVVLGGTKLAKLLNIPLRSPALK